MALGNVLIKDMDGNILYDTGSSGEEVMGLPFDVPLQPTLFTGGYGKANGTRLKPGDVCYTTSPRSAVNDFDIIERAEATDEEEMNVNFLHGIPAYHIRKFFHMSGNPGGSGKPYVMFTDCSVNWGALEIMQRAVGGMINQIGTWMEQSLWKANGALEQCNLNLVKGLNDVAMGLAEQNQPFSFIFSANPSNTGADTTGGCQIDLNKISSCIRESSRISCILGQMHHEKISTMQMRNRNHTPVGFLGAVMGAIAEVNVYESIARVKQLNLFVDDSQEIELGFGGINLDETEENFLSLNRYESLFPSLLDELGDKGYIFPIKYAGRESGVYISKDQICSYGDFRTIVRNRTINKSRCAVRATLLPYVSSPLMVNPSTGFLAPSRTTVFKILIGDILAKMQAAQEISGYTVTIDSNQNVSMDDTLRISYVFVPVGVAMKTYVEEGLSLTTNKTQYTAIINNVVYSWSTITLSSTALGIDEGSMTPEGVSAIKWSKGRKVESNYGMGGRLVSRGFGNITYMASITMDYVTQQLLRSVYGPLLEIGKFDPIISFVSSMAGEDWIAMTVTLKGCIFTEDCLESQQDDTNITHEFNLDPFDIQIGSGDTIQAVMDVTFEGKSPIGKNEWFTPPCLFRGLGSFDLDPCSPVNRSWDTARHHHTTEDDGLQQPQFGRMFRNPPYDIALIVWFIRRCVEHKNAVALTFARTDTRLSRELILPNADSILFIKGRFSFYHVTGEQGGTAGAPSCLIAFNKENAAVLETCGINGKLVKPRLR